MARQLARGMGSFFKDCDCAKPTRCPHPYSIRFRDALGKQRGWFQQLPTGIGQVTRIGPLLTRHVSVVPMAAALPQGANRRDRGRVGIRQERRDRNGPSKAVIRLTCHKTRLRPQSTRSGPLPKQQ
ncbi:hypothetical protein Shyd_95260 [Streptomyces hydrogenans]|uniref:Uncharacterized protein n=1 Tax=Streptomyces hydrogenans TaxID=1873719 RepID=A0ABQ3PSZ7_9ACTN|nr:hypothetical protein GCM10018784_06660 [Streptomyces hydrogenans]GHI28155.1 hypothetical protein Shyd_95260 [Streptomyces hydrogenans]